MTNYIHYKVVDEITYAFLNFNGANIEIKQLISKTSHTYWAYDYLSMLGLM